MQRIAFFMLLSFCFIMNVYAQEPIQPLPHEIALNAEKVALGERLFHDPRLSKDNSISCSTCHDLTTGGTDHTPVSIGIQGQKGEIRAPSVYNSFFNFRQFWNGRAADLKEQAKGPVENPKEMGAKWNEVVAKLNKDPSYVKAFQQIYGQPITTENIVDAIAEYEHSLITPSRFDDYLRGLKDAITPQETHGYELFKSYGCTACHNGINVGGSMYQKLGVVHDYYQDRGTPITAADRGRYEITQVETDKYLFKVPSLRNVGLLSPYFHDGSVSSLEEAVRKMGHYQLGIEIPDQDVKDITAFLRSLTGKDLEKQQGNSEKK